MKKIIKLKKYPVIVTLLFILPLLGMLLISGAQATLPSTVTKHLTLTCDPCAQSDIPFTTGFDHIYHITGNLNISGNQTGTQTGVVFVDGNLNFTSDYTYGTNSTGAVFVVKGNINIASNVIRVDAVLISEGTIYTAAAADATCATSSVSSNQLTINGSLVSLNPDKPIKFCRDLTDDTQPAEKINHQVKYSVILRDLYSDTLQKWSEIDASIPLPAPGPTSAPTPTPTPAPIPTTAPTLSPTFKTKFFNSGSGTSLSIPLPTGGTTQNDLMIAQIYTSNDSGSFATITPPAGWSLIRNLDLADVSTSRWRRMAYYWKIASASEPSSYNWNYSVSLLSTYGIIATYTGANLTTPINIDAGQTTTNTTFHSTPSITTTVNHTLDVAFYFIINTAGTSFTLSTPTDMLQEWLDSSTFTNAIMAITGLSQPTAGVVGGKVSTSSVNAIGFEEMIAIQP